MNTPAQDIDSGTGEVITPGQPVDHVDTLDGQSAGHHIEPEADDTGHKPGDVVDEKPPGMSREEIYGKATDIRDAEADEALAGMDATERAHYHRMIAEASGVTEEEQDPFDGDGAVKKGWIDPNATPAPSASPDGAPVPAGEPIVETEQPVVDTAPEMTTIVVYGMRQEVPTAEVNAAGGKDSYQKIVAADERMKRASTYEASLRAYDQELQQRAANLQTSPATDSTVNPELPPTGVQGESVDVQASAKKLVNAMYSGDRDAAITEAAEVLTSFRDDVARAATTDVGQPAAPTVSVEEQRIAHERANVAAAERAEANQVFVDEFSDLAGPTLKQATYAMVQKVAAEPLMYGRPLAEITREAGSRVRADVYGTNPAPVVPAPAGEIVTPTPTLDNRMTLKRRTVVQPLIPASGRFTESADASQQPESNAQYVARMRENRGQHA